MQDGNRIVWTYTDEDGTAWNIAAKKVYVTDVTDGAKYGGSAGDEDQPQLPGNFRPRRVKCVASGHDDRWVIAYTNAATIWTTPGTTLTLNANGADVAYTTTKYKRGERANRAGTQEST